MSVTLLMRVLAAVAIASGAWIPLTSTHTRDDVASPTHETARAVTFTGVVRDQASAPVPQALVHVLPWRAAAMTDDSGTYRIPVEAARVGDRATLVIQRIGYGEDRREIVISSENVVTNVQLQQAVLALEQLVVTGERERVQGVKLGYSIAGADLQGKAAPAGVMFRRAQGAPPPPASDPDFNTESYAALAENPFLSAGQNPLSTFSIDVDRASYANVRRMIRAGRLPPVDAVRVEELINYFTYDDAEPRGKQPFTVTTELAAAPWQPEHQLLRIALKARSLEAIDAPPSNLVFLIDVSGSMTPANKLPLLKRAFGLLVNELRSQDRVAIVVYAGSAGLVLESTRGDRKEEIMAAIERLEAGGSTAGGAGLQLAYDVARRQHVRGGNNRVMLATDGDFNVGASSDAEMLRLIEQRRAEGTFLSVLGFGTGNLKDSKMETIADAGNGNYAYIDDIAEARKVLVHEIGGTLFTVAKDVKLQVEFNPQQVRGYRLIGYENRLLAAQDFNNDAKDAGELGAGHSVTALYEVIPVSAKTNVALHDVDALRYQDAPAISSTASSRELAFVKLRYKLPEGDTSTLVEHPVVTSVRRPSTDFTFASAVASYGMILRNSPHRGETSLERVLALARDGIGDDRGGYRAGFLELVEQTRRIARPVVDGGR